jgi:hypothetical protein
MTNVTAPDTGDRESGDDGAAPCLQLWLLLALEVQQTIIMNFHIMTPQATCRQILTSHLSLNCRIETVCRVAVARPELVILAACGSLAPFALFLLTLRVIESFNHDIQILPSIDIWLTLT